MWKTRFIGIMVGQKDEEHLWMGPNRYRYDARLLRLSRLVLLFFANGSIADIGAHRSSRWNAPSVTSIVHRHFWDTSKCLLLHFNWGIHVQSGHFLARHEKWWRNIMQVIFFYNNDSNYKKSIKKCTIIWNV